MEEFCGSQFWDTDLSWNTENSNRAPDLTPCFQNTVLVWIPCAFLWIFSVINLILSLQSTDEPYVDTDSSDSFQNSNSQTKSKSEKNTINSNLNSNSKEIKSARSTSNTSRKTPRSPPPISWNAFNLSKIVVCLLLIVTQILRLSTTLKLELSHFIVYPVDTYIPVLRICTYALILACIVISKMKGTRSSTIQFTFWFLLAVCQVFKFRTTFLIVYDEARKHGLETDSLTLTIVVELIDYPLILGQFLLHCWADSDSNGNGYVKFNSDTKLPCPENTASVLNGLLFSWFDTLAWKGHKKSLESKDLWELNPEDATRTVAAHFDKNWGSKLAKVARSKPSKRSSPGARVGVLSVIISTFWGAFAAGSVLKLIPDLLVFASPQILNLLIAFMSSDEDTWKGYFYAVLLFLTAFVSTLASVQYNHVMYTTGMRVKSAIVSVLYRKSLVVSNAAKKESTTGEIVNLMSVDVQNVVNVIPYVNMLWISPIQIALSLYFLWDILGPSVFAGLGVMILLIPINGVLGEFVRMYQMKQMTLKDERVKLISEILSGIKILKLYAWEPSFQEEIMKIRGKEIKNLRDASYLYAFNDFLWTCSQFMVAIATFATYVLVDDKNILDAQKAFVALSLLNVMTVPLTALPMVIIWAIQASVSLGRLNKFMNAEEIDPEAISHDEGEVDPIVVENGYFSWDGYNERDANDATNKTTGYRNKCVLKNINLRVQEGSLVAVVGTVGSGKSSLISAILGELEKISGRINTKGTTSYVAQTAWIQNGTLQENVLFGQSFNVLKYNRVIDACALGPDLDILPGRDKIEIGEKGINLSGGQKQRVSIARAVYNNSDLYLLDDPLSAVDSHVGKHIFDKVLSSKGLLGRKTRILVTNALHFLPQVDHVIVMKDGEISESGTYEQLLAQKGAFSELISEYTNKLEEESETDSLETRTEEQRKHSVSSQIQKSNKFENSGEVANGGQKVSQEKDIAKQNDKLIEDEGMETESVKWSIYLDYFRAAGWGRVIPAILVYILYQGFAVGSNFWLTVWSNEPIVNGTQGNRDLYLGVYAGLGVAQSIAFMVATVLLCLSAIRSASIFHLNMLARILRAPMSFFDTTPSGRIVNRFSKDIDVMDNTLSFLIRQWIGMLAAVLSTLGIIIYTTPIFLAVIIPIGIFYYFVQKFYIPTSRQLKRLESVTRSPIYSQFGETISGASTIRAYGQQQRFITESEIKVDEHQACYYPSIVSNRWLSIRLESAGGLIIFFAALFAVLSRESLNPGLVGLTITYALQITFYLSYLVRTACDVEANIVAVERIKEYGEVPQEAPWQSEWRKPPKTWPAYGSIEFKNYQTRYRDGLDLVLKDITCTIEPGEKIGVVGRTGAGKSSLTLALFRIIEGVGRGSITVDGEDIKKLGLHDVRSRLTIIPQDPVLFSGTLRFNLDPFSKYSDNAVWRALELSDLKPFVEGLEGGLEFKVSEGGDNLSVGQKQLVCLSRAVLRKSKILVLDEATAAMDLETDDLIQKTIRSEFKDSTVVTIAHRLNTIMDSTRVMVVDNGTIREFDSPQKLLNNTESQFYAMANDAGLISNNADLE